MLKNNRDTSIKSLKGPRRKLELIVIDGKRYIKKRDLQKYFFDDMWNIKDFQYHFGLGHRIVRNSLYKWFTKEDIDKSHRDKIAKKQIGDSNSNKVNWYRPRKLLPLEKLKEAISYTNNKRELKEVLGLTSWDLSYLQQYYNFKLPSKVKLIDDLSHHHLTKSEIKLFSKVMVTIGLHRGFFSKDKRKLCEAIRDFYNLSWEIRFISRKLRRYYRVEMRDTNTHLVSNLIEYRFYKTLLAMDINCIPQYYFRYIKAHVDFLLIDLKTVLELDGQFHSEIKDQNRDKYLESIGYKVIRINLNKEGLDRFSSYKKIRLCLKKYLSNQ